MSMRILRSALDDRGLRVRDVAFAGVDVVFGELSPSLFDSVLIVVIEEEEDSSLSIFFIKKFVNRLPSRPTC